MIYAFDRLLLSPAYLALHSKQDVSWQRKVNDLMARVTQALLFTLVAPVHLSVLSGAGQPAPYPTPLRVLGLLPDLCSDGDHFHPGSSPDQLGRRGLGRWDFC